MITEMVVFIYCPDAQSTFFFFFHIVLPCQMLLTEGDMKHWPFGKLSALC